MTRWQRWHDDYADERSPLSQRLRIVRSHIAIWLDERPDGQLAVVSVCAGQGHDLIGVLAGRPDRSRVRARLVEYDPGNVALARASAAELGRVEVVCADAGDPASYVGAVPADLVLLVGVLGNISDTDVHQTITALPQLCAAGATVIWTRHRRPPNLVPAVRGWFGDAGFDEVAVHAPDDVLFTVGVHRFAGVPQPLTPSDPWFRFQA